MSASVQGVANLAMELILRSIQPVVPPVASPARGGGGVTAPTPLADTPRVDGHHVDVTA